MLAQLKMRLETGDREMGYFQSSSLQGVLMEQLDPDYAEILHRPGFHPYSQYLRQDREQGLCWTVQTVTKEAYEAILLPLLSRDFTAFTIRKRQIPVRIQEKQLKTTAQQALLEEFYDGADVPRVSLEFLTPTAFKQSGVYVNYPDIRLLLQSLMNKYSAASGNLEMFDEETLKQLTECVSVPAYQLRSARFPLEGVKIPSFLGRMTLQVRGSGTMARYIRLLARFGEYSGAGIKTGMGMGALRIQEGFGEKEKA